MGLGTPFPPGGFLGGRASPGASGAPFSGFSSLLESMVEREEGIFLLYTAEPTMVCSVQMEKVNSRTISPDEH